MRLTYSEFLSLCLDELAKRRRIWRIKRQITACTRGMEVCQRIIDNELLNKAAYQSEQMHLIKELSDMED